jgi:hypothetical protein
MAADAWVVHDKTIEYMGDGTIDLDGDSFIAILCLSTSNIATTSVNAYATVTNEHTTQFGYTQGTLAVASPTWVESGGTVTFDCDPLVWTASGGSIVARFAAIYDDTVAAPVADPILCDTLLDNSPADVTATDTNTFTVDIHASGVFTSARA